MFRRTLPLLALALFTLFVARPVAAQTPAPTLTDLATALDAVATALDAGDSGGAVVQLAKASQVWPTVEGEVASSDPAAYSAFELDLGTAAAALRAAPADVAAAAAAVARMRATLDPFVQTTATYTAFDAAAILLREGLEALLVLVALLAFLRRSGHSDKRGWIWAGGAAGVFASMLAGFALQAVFSAASAGHNREIIEGATGILAAAMLFYVAYWLHSKARLGAWQAFIDERTGQALAGGSLLGLATLAFLAVFREGAETVVFYLGMAASISLSELLAGLALGSVALVVIAVLMLVFSVRLPLQLFFRVAGLLVYYLGFKFVGTGLHALQVAQVLPSTPAPVPDVLFLGLYPTWETLLPQVGLLLATVGGLLYLRARNQRTLATQSA